MFLRTRASVIARQDASPRWHRWAARVVLATILATALAYFPYRLLDGSGARKAAELRVQYERTAEACRILAEENTHLRGQIDALKNDVTAIEDIARSELGMVRPGEVIFRIDESPGDTRSNADDSREEPAP
ncbi:MAG: septum formation initiator family protein [Proteobacteria bacterium]|nr:septum formation initiator family protein [Pseudomonadota bacterium]